MFKIELKYLSEADEVAVVANTTQTRDTALSHPLSGEDILEFQRIAGRSRCRGGDTVRGKTCAFFASSV